MNKFYEELDESINDHGKMYLISLENVNKSLEKEISLSFVQLINKLTERNSIDETITEVFTQVDRFDFCPNTDECYRDGAQPIGFNTTISAPHMHGLTMIQLVGRLKTSKKALDIGIGSGYMSVAMAKMMKEQKAVVYGLDHINKVLKLAKENIEKSHKSLLDSGKIVLIEGDGRNGLEEYAPYDVIHLGAAAPMAMVDQILEQLAPGGFFCGPVIEAENNINIDEQDDPIGQALWHMIHQQQQFMIIKKDMQNKIEKINLLPVMYGELKSKESQWVGEDLNHFENFQSDFSISESGQYDDDEKSQQSYKKQYQSQEKSDENLEDSGEWEDESEDIIHFQDKVKKIQKTEHQQQTISKEEEKQQNDIIEEEKIQEEREDEIIMKPEDQQQQNELEYQIQNQEKNENEQIDESSK